MNKKERQERIEGLSAQLELMRPVEHSYAAYPVPGITLRHVDAALTHDKERGHMVEEYRYVPKLTYRKWLFGELEVRRQYTQWPELAYVWVGARWIDGAREITFTSPKGSATYALLHSGVWGLIEKKGKVR